MPNSFQHSCGKRLCRVIKKSTWLQHSHQLPAAASSHALQGLCAGVCAYLSDYRHLHLATTFSPAPSSSFLTHSTGSLCWRVRIYQTTVISIWLKHSHQLPAAATSHALQGLCAGVCAYLSDYRPFDLATTFSPASSSSFFTRSTGSLCWRMVLISSRVRYVDPGSDMEWPWYLCVCVRAYVCV